MIERHHKHKTYTIHKQNSHIHKLGLSFCIHLVDRYPASILRKDIICFNYEVFVHKVTNVQVVNAIATTWVYGGKQVKRDNYFQILM